MKGNLFQQRRGAVSILVADFLRNPNTTVDWEVKLYEISEGKADLKDFIGDVEKNKGSYFTK